MILVFGGETLRDFAFAMMVGVLSGTYSSIFIATPVLIAWKEREPQYRSRAARIRELMGCVPAFPEDNLVAKVGGGTERDASAGLEGADEFEEMEEEAEDALGLEHESLEVGAEAPGPVLAGDGNGSEPEPEPEPVAASDERRHDRPRAPPRRAQAPAGPQERKHGRPR